jgi:hypothetical protein
MRDTHATGTGSIMGGGTAGYCTGNLNIEGYVQPYDDPTFGYPGGSGVKVQCVLWDGNLWHALTSAEEPNNHVCVCVKKEELHQPKC